MIRLLFRKDVPRSVFFLLLFLAGIYLQLDAVCYHNFMYTPYIDAYIETYNTGDREAFYASAAAAMAECNQRESEIYAMHDPENPEIGPSLMDQLAGGPPTYTSRSLQELHQKLFNQPGKYSPTFRTDIYTTRQLHQMMEEQAAVHVQVVNNIELTKRVLRRTREPVLVETYQKTLELYEQIQLVDTPMNTQRITTLFTFFDQDVTIYLLIFLLNFWVFSSLNQSGISQTTLCSSRGIRWFTARRLLSVFGINTLVYAAYIALMLILCGENVFTSPVMALPVQLLEGYAFAPWPVTLGEYLICIIAMRFLICTVLSMLVLLCSVIVRKVSFSLVLGAVPTALLCMAARNQLPFSSRLNGLLSGDFSRLFDEYAFIFPFNKPVYIVPFFFLAFGAAAILSAAAVILAAPAAARR